MNETSAETLTLVIERGMAHPPEKIWRALTQPHLIAQWLMKNDFEPIVGHDFKLRMDPQPNSSVVVACQVLRIEPNKTLSYTWSAYGLNSVVTWTLTPARTGGQLRMEQTGFRRDQRNYYEGAKGGWQQFFANLEQLLARLD